MQMYTNTKHGGSVVVFHYLPLPTQGDSPKAREREMGEPDDAVLFVGVSLVLGIASRHLLRGTRVPYTVALLILGVALGSLGENRSFF
jgi:hypothetical protein